MRFDRLLPWSLRAAWAALPFVAGPSLADALDGWGTALRTTASVGLWAAWAVTLVATLVPHPVSLTVLRIAAPAGCAASVAAALSGAAAAAGAAWWLVVLALAFLPDTGVAFVNGPAYPNERRFPLRVPAPLLLGPLFVAWAVVVAAPSAAVLLVADRRWLAAALVALPGVPAAGDLARSLHGLSRRWVVFVPAGLVLHDANALVDPVLFMTAVIERLAPAEAGTEALDLSQRALGIPLELRLHEKVPMVLTTPGNRLGEAGSSARLMFTPTRPGAVLAEAARRRIPTG